jgi:Uma2 family endonuclease
MATHPKPYYTPEEYLALERAAVDTKSDYLDGEIYGEIYAMAGATEDHNLIAGNIYRLLGNRFEGGPCRAYINDMRVRVAPDGLYTYPDVVAVCGEREFLDERRDTLLNPTVLFEVLSPSTEGYDRGAKFAQYWRLASLTDYVLVAQDRVRVEHSVRQGEGWFVTALTALDATLRLPALDCALPLAAVYADVRRET